MKKFRIFLSSFIGSIVCVCILISGNVQAEDKHFVIGVEDLEYYPLWRYDKSLNEYKGLGRAILDEFAKSKGYHFEYKAYPIKRLVKKLVAKEIDFKFPDNNYWSTDAKRGVDVTYSKPVINYIDGVFVKPENVGRGTDSIKTLGSVLGFTPWDWLDRINQGKVILKETPNFEALISQVILNRIDGAYVNADVVRYHLKVSGREKQLVFDPGISHIKGTYLLSTTQHAEIIKEFDIWLTENKLLLEKLKKKFEIE